MCCGGCIKRSRRIKARLGKRRFLRFEVERRIRGGIFRARKSKDVYRALGIKKEQIERRRPYQSYIETTFGIQKRMGDWHFAKAQTEGANL
jgi:hypothetical protein